MKRSFNLALKAGVGLGLATFTRAAPTAQNTSMVTDFSQLTPSTEIDWKPCFDNYTCTHLLVPLDYQDASVRTAAIAVIKLAAVNETKETKNILVNPGGPGGSGVKFLIEATSIFPQIFGPDFNVIGFDPRGATNPSVSEEDFNGVFGLDGACGDLAKQELNSSTAYVRTPAVARDMLTITKKIASKNGDSPDETLLYYYGASYGSMLGATIATLFPDRVGRLAIDAIHDGDVYYRNYWNDALADMDEAQQQFFSLCHAAGPERCVYYEDSAEKIENKYRKLILQLKNNPIAVWDKSVTQIPTLATYGQLKMAFLNAVYRPEDVFPVLAQVLTDLETRNGTSLLQLSGVPCYDCDKSQLSVPDLMSLTGIACTDADGRGNVATKEAWLDSLDTAMSISSYAGDAWASSSLSCRTWPFRPPPSQKFDGKYGATTKTTLLILSNRIDPVCPIRNARKMASLFPGSVLLSQDAVGHGTVSALSNCTAAYMREYFHSGRLPPVNTTCHPNTRPFLKDIGV